MKNVKVELRLFAAGYCRHPEWLTMRGGSWLPVPFPAGFACIRHPERGYVLFDTGYTSRFFNETNRFPDWLYRAITPVTYREENSAANQLMRAGIATEDVRYVVLSHFHADHVAGARDFPQARFLYLRDAYAAVKRLGRFAAVRAGFLPGLLPDDFEARSLFVDDAPVRRLPAEYPFTAGFDLFGDGSLTAVDISGHAAGQIGLFLSTAKHSYFLCADAVWSSRAVRERRRPHGAAGFIMADRARYADSFERVCRLHRHFPQLRIVPSHCQEALTMWGYEEGAK